MTPGGQYNIQYLLPTSINIWWDIAWQLPYAFFKFFQDPEEQRYLVDNFWLQSLSWKQKLNALAFNNLFEARDLVNSLYNLALENNMEEKVKAKWVGILKFINYLIENIGNRSHSLALQQLREKYGGTKGMSKSDKKEADKILKRSGAVSAVCAPPPIWAPPPLMGPFPNMPFMAPTQQFSELNIRRPFTGNCFKRLPCPTQTTN